jgi:pimeloyl-ACP methyl ester carboxylesterase
MFYFFLAYIHRQSHVKKIDTSFIYICHFKNIPRMKQLILLICFLFILPVNSIKAETGIDTTEVIDVGGTKQFVSIKGKDRTKPLLLFLHGGPGGSVMNTAEKFTSKLQDSFVVVQWDQRETGKTLELNASPVPLTVHLFEKDTHDIIKSLLRQFDHKKLYLVGHSWGTILGFYIADKYPELLYAYIPISPCLNQIKSENMAIEILKKDALEKKNTLEFRELSSLHVPFKNWEQLYISRKWLFAYSGHPIADADTTAVKEYVKGLGARWQSMWDEMAQLKIEKNIKVVKCPIYLCVGRKDYQTHFSISENYFNQLQAPQKKLIWFENSGHSIPDTEPDFLQKTIIETVLPETFSEK